MSNVKVSLIASSVRPQLYEAFFKSLQGTSVEYEVVFAGNNFPDQYLWGYDMRTVVERPISNESWGTPMFKYIETKNIKPAQCYEIARRHATGEVVVWVADDCEFSNDVIGKAYHYWKGRLNPRLILSIQTRETGYNLPEGKLFDMNMHRFFGGDSGSPLMAPLGMMSRKVLDDLGGIDRRYVCGQYENDIVMRVLAAGGDVEIFGDEHCFIDIDHLGKSIAIGESKDMRDFLRRPFASGYAHDRAVLEMSWVGQHSHFKWKLASQDTFYMSKKNVPGAIPVRYDKFEPFEDADILTVSQSHKGKWE